MVVWLVGGVFACSCVRSLVLSFACLRDAVFSGVVVVGFLVCFFARLCILCWRNLLID